MFTSIQTLCGHDNYATVKALNCYLKKPFESKTHLIHRPL